MNKYLTDWKGLAFLLTTCFLSTGGCTNKDSTSPVAKADEFYQCVVTEMTPLSAISQLSWNKANGCYAQKWQIPYPAVIRVTDTTNSTFEVSFPYRTKRNPSVQIELSGKALRVGPTAFLNDAFYGHRMWGHTQLVATGESVYGYPIFKPQGVSRERFVVGKEFVVIAWMKSDTAFSLSELEGSLLYARSRLAGRSEVSYRLAANNLNNIERIDSVIRNTLNSYQISE